MDESKKIKKLHNLEEDFKYYICKFGCGALENLNETLDPIIDDFDNVFIQVQNDIPFNKQIPNDAQKKILEAAKERYHEKKEKIENKYMKETQQIQERFESIMANIHNKVLYFASGLDSLKSEFITNRKQIYIKQDEVKNQVKQNFNIDINKIDSYLNDIKKNNDERKKSEEEIIAKKYQLQIDQRNNKLNELNRVINGINLDKDSKINAADEKIEKIKQKHASDLDILNHKHELDMEDLHAKQENAKNEIFVAEERINSLKRRAMFSKSNFEARIKFMINSLQMDHKLRMKENENYITEVNHKIDHVNQKIEGIDQSIDDSILAKLEIWQKRVDDEISTRNKRLQETEQEMKKDYEKQIEEKREILHQLNIEISDNQLKSVHEAARIQNEMYSRMKELQTKFNNDVKKLRAELKQIAIYSSKIQYEWDTLRDSTQCIYDNKFSELKNMLDLQKSKHDTHFNQLIDKETPVPDKTDYMQLLKEELEQIENDYILEESKIEGEKLVQLRLKCEEERSRGVLATRKANIEELNTAKQTEMSMKENYLTLDKDEKETIEKNKIEVDQLASELDQKSATTLIELKAQQDEIRQKINAEIERINKRIENAQKALDKTNDKLSETRDTLSNINKHDDEKEAELRNLYEEKRQEIQDRIDQLKGSIASLKETKVALLTKEKKEKTRLDTTSNTLNSEQKRYSKESERGKREIEFKFQRLTEEQERILKGMQDRWEKEEEDYKIYKEQIKEEIERIKENIEKRREKIDNEFERKAAEMKNKIEKKYNEVKDERNNADEEDEAELREMIENEKLEYAKIERYKKQDNSLLLRKLEEQHQKEYEFEVSENKKITYRIKDLQSQLLDLLQWVCPDCENLEKEIKDVKKTILDIVERMHEIEKEDGNRLFILSHFGKTTRNLPRLAAPNETANIV